MAAQITRASMSRYTDGINKISARFQDAARVQLERLDWAGDMTGAIDAAVDIVNASAGAAAEASAQLGAVFYDGVSELQTGRAYGADAYSDHLDEGTERAVRGIAQEGVDGNIAGMIGQLLARIDYETKRAAGNSVIQNARRDTRQPRYARVPYGETCPFCIMLASRGPIYYTAESAGFNNHYHANCDCRIVPMFDVAVIPNEVDGKPTGGYIARARGIVEGYDPDALFQRYWQMVADGKRWAAKDGWARARLRSGSANPANMSMRRRHEYFASQMQESLRQLRGASDYEDFMARAQNVASVWDAMRSRITATKDAQRRKVAKQNWDDSWRTLNVEAGEVRKQFLDE